MNSLLSAHRRLLLGAASALGILAAGVHAGWATMLDAQADFVMHEVALLGGPAAERDLQSMTEVHFMEPDKVAGFDLTSDAIVRYRLGHVTMLIPRKLVGINFASMPTHRPPKIYSPELALLYPGFGPIPAGGETKYRLLAPGWTPDLIVVWIAIPDEPERVAAFYKPLGPDAWIPGPFRLFRRRSMPEFGLYANPDSTNQLIISCIEGPPAIPDQSTNTLSSCNVQRYMFGNIPITYSFQKRLLPEWQAIDDAITKLINTFAERK